MKYQEPFSQILHEINNILITKYNKKKMNLCYYPYTFYKKV